MERMPGCSALGRRFAHNECVEKKTEKKKKKKKKKKKQKKKQKKKKKLPRHRGSSFNPKSANRRDKRRIAKNSAGAANGALGRQRTPKELASGTPCSPDS